MAISRRRSIVALYIDKHVEQNDDADDREDHLEHILRHGHHVEDGQNHAARENGLSVRRDIDLPVKAWQV